jgi:micrococcal nuclease
MGGWTRRPIVLSAAWFLCAAWEVAAAGPVDVPGKVVYVDDGDTVVMLLANMSQMKVRLASIDAPESSHTNKEKGRAGQPYSENSKQFLSKLVKGAEVTARCFEKDRYDRDVCDLFVKGESANRKLVAAGLAWANQASGGRYLRDKSLVKLEEDARGSKLGLWRGKAPVPPWEWRKVCWVEGKCD